MGGEVVAVEIEGVVYCEEDSRGEAGDGGEGKGEGNPAEGVLGTAREFWGEEHGDGDGGVEVFFDAEGPEVCADFEVVGVVVLDENGMDGELGGGGGVLAEEEGGGDGGGEVEEVGGVDFEGAADEEAAGVEGVVALVFAEDEAGDEEAGEDEEDIGADGGAAPGLGEADDEVGAIVGEGHEVPAEDEEDGGGAEDVERGGPGGRDEDVCFCRHVLRGYGWVGTVARKK